MRLLFVVRNFSHGGAQPLRFRKFVEQIKEQHKVYILEFSQNEANGAISDGVTYYRIKYSRLGAVLNKTSQSSLGELSENLKKKSLPLKIFRFVKSLFFPDPFVLEISKTKKKVSEIINKHDIEMVVGSAHPFSVLMISKAVQKKGIPFIYDIGDPFYNNAKNGWLKNTLAKKYETRYLKFINGLVVTNLPTKEQYEECYKEIFFRTPVFIVEQGVELPEHILYRDLNSNIPVNKPNKNEIQLLYAGQFYDKLREPYKLYEAIRTFNNENAEKVILSVYGSISPRFLPKGPHDNIIFKGFTPNEKIWEEINRTDIVVFIDNAYGIQTPGKVFEVIASQKPVLFISDYINSPAYLIAKDYPNIFLSRNDKSSIIDMINHIIKMDAVDFKIDTLSAFTWKNRASEFTQILKLIYSRREISDS